MAPELIIAATTPSTASSSGSSSSNSMPVQQFSAKKADVFSLGVVLFSLVSGFPPYFQSAARTDPYYRFFAEKKHLVYWSQLARKFGKIYSPDFMDLINGMLAFNPDERFDLQVVKSHPWIARPID